MHLQPLPTGQAATKRAHRTHAPVGLYLILVCLVGSTGGFLFGFDTSVISGVIEYISSPKVFDLAAIAKGWTVSCIIIGCMFGCVLAGPLSSRYGRRKTLLLTALVFLVSTLGCAWSNQLITFIEFRIVAGIAVGAASMLAPIYIRRAISAKASRQADLIEPVCYFLRAVGGLLF